MYAMENLQNSVTELINLCEKRNLKVNVIKNKVVMRCVDEGLGGTEEMLDGETLLEQVVAEFRQ